MFFFLKGFVLAILMTFFCFLSIRENKLIHTEDHNLDAKALRIGGVVCVISFVTLIVFFGSDLIKSVGYISFAILLIACVGTYDDLIGKVPALCKLIFGVLSATFASLDYVSFGKINWLVGGHSVANLYILTIILALTFFSVLAVQGFNVIDGSNCLLSVNVLPGFCLLNMLFQEQSFVFEHHLASFLMGLSVALVLANLRKDKIFHGDGGAFFLGASLVFLSIYFYFKVDGVSILFPVVVTFLPFYELVRSAMRRLLDKKQIFSPDRLHLHCLVFDFFIGRHLQIAYLMPALMLSPFPVLSGVVCWFYIDNTSVLMLICITQILIYELLYRTLTNAES
jgi:UDP-N-acetylmuramyl pentapeptide phosphotransferase/UDP-N-acetylglucosamine-1-phosphate transferase